MDSSIPNISIIIPVYNAESWLRCCLESVVSQTFDDFEVILVDDGSSDASCTICKYYESIDHRVKYTYQANKGVSASRNNGISLARGKWIAFIDSDDWINSDYLLQLSLLASDYTDSDWITSGLTYVYTDGTIKSENPVAGCYNLMKEDGFYKTACQLLVTSPVAKLYKREIINDKNLLFDESLAYGEDRDFNLRYLASCKYCVSTSYCGYNYRRNIPTSLSAIKLGNILKGDIDYWNNLYRETIRRKFLSERMKLYLVNRLFHFINDNLMLKNENKDNIRYMKEHVEWTFLSDNIKYINYNIFIKRLIANKRLGLVQYIYRLRR